MKYHYKRGLQKDWFDTVLTALAIIGIVMLLIMILKPTEFWSLIIAG